MSFFAAVALGLIFSAGTYLILRRDAVRVVIGSLIISQTANMYLMAMAGTEGTAPILPHHSEDIHMNAADPVPQALVLTAIVIGFATTAFLLSLTYRFYEENQEVDLQNLRGEDM